jgi:hypothetical protein
MGHTNEGRRRGGNIFLEKNKGAGTLARIPSLGQLLSIVCVLPVSTMCCERRFSPPSTVHRHYFRGLEPILTIYDSEIWVTNYLK